MDSTSANPNQTLNQSSPVTNDNAGPQVYVITPNQLAKLGLSTQIHSIIAATQVPSKQTVLQTQSASLNDEEQSLSISSSTTSDLEKDESSSNQIRKSVNVEIVEKGNTPSSMQNEVKSKICHLLNTDESMSSPSTPQNVSTSVVKDTSKIRILNYTASSPYHGVMHAVIKHKRKSDATIEENELRHHKLLTKGLSHDSIVKEQTVKSAPIIINSRCFTEATKALPLKLEIVSNEVVNFSPMEIQNILKHNSPAHSKAAESIPQSTSHTIINKTAYLQKPPCTAQDGVARKVEKHFKKKLYETFHIADNAVVEKQSVHICDEVVKLDTPADRSGSKIVENDAVRLQSFKIYGKTKDKNSFLPPTKTFVVRQAQVQILNPGVSATELECTASPLRQEAEIDSRLGANVEKENKAEALLINNDNTELKATESNCVQKLSSPALLNSLLQNKTYVGVAANINISDNTPLNALHRADVSGLEVEKRDHKSELQSKDKSDDFNEEETKEIITFQLSEQNTHTVKNSIDKQEQKKVFNSDVSQLEQKEIVKKDHTPRVLNLELQEKKGIVTDKSFFQSHAVNACHQQRKEENFEEHQKGTAPPAVVYSKLQRDVPQTVNTLTVQSSAIKLSVIKKSSVTKKVQCKLPSVEENADFMKDNSQCCAKSKNAKVIKSDDDILEHSSDSDKVDVTTPKLKYFKSGKIREETLTSNIHESKHSDVIDLDVDEIITKRNTKREREENTPSIIKFPPSDVDLYVQSKTSGRKRKFVDYKILSGISNSSDSDSVNKDATLKKCVTTDVICEDKSPVETQLVKKRSRGRPKKQINLDVLYNDVLNLETEKQCGTSILDSVQTTKKESRRESTVERTPPQKILRGRRGRSAGAKTDISEYVNTSSESEKALDLSSVSRSENTTPVSSKPLVDSESLEKRLRSYTRILLEKMNSAENNSNSKNPNSEENSPRKKRHTETNLKAKRPDESENDSFSKSVVVDKKRRGRSEKIQAEAEDQISGKINLKINTNPTGQDEEDVEIKSERKGKGRYKKTEMEAEDSNSALNNQIDTEKNTELNKEDVEIKSERKGRGRPKKTQSEATLNNEINVDHVEIKSERKGRKHFEKIQGEAKDSKSTSNNQIDPEVDIEHTEVEEADVKIKSERRGRGRPKKTRAETQNSNSTSNNLKDPEISIELDKAAEIKPEKRGRGRSRTINISENDSKIVVKRRRGRPKQIKDVSSQEIETELKSNKTRSGVKKPKIAEVNLSEDRVSSDIELNSTNLYSSTDPLDIDSILDEQAESSPSISKSNCIKNSPGDTPDRKKKIVVKKHRGRPKAVINETEFKCEAETERNYQNANVDSSTESKSAEKESKNETEFENTAVELQQKRRGRKRKIIASEENVEEFNNVTCAACNSVLKESQWMAHSEVKHNNLAWKTNDVPLDLNDHALVERILTDLHKSKKVLHCEICGCEIQTLSGYAEHKNKCIEKPDGVVEPAPKKNLISTVLDSLFSNIATPTKKEEELPESTSTKEDIVTADSNFVEEILPPLGANDVRCAVCKDVMPKGQWPLHKQKKHNNLAWKVGDKPLDLNDRSVVMRILTDLCKSKKALFCEVCGVGKKSVLGYLSHKSQCQKSDSEIDAMKVKCELCGRSMLPVSLQRHMALSHSTNATEIDLSCPVSTIRGETDPQGKRRAANKAAGLIHSFAKDMLNEVSSAKFKKYVKNVNFRSIEAAIYKFSEDIQKQSYMECVFDECNYRTSEHEDLFYHIENCDKNSDTNYTCNFCLATFRTRQSVRDHIKLHHGSEENRALISQFSDNEFNNESEEDYENDCASDLEHSNAENQFLDLDDAFGVYRPRRTQQTLSSDKSNNYIHFLRRKSKKSQSIYNNAYWWTEKFCQENYKLQNIFPCEIYSKKEDWTQFDPTQIVNYLPKLRYSVDTARIKVNSIVNPICYEYVWKKYKLFESEALNNDGNSIFFCGGPINALAWVPTPHTECSCDQILAVSVAPDPDEKYNTNALYECDGLIQFWNVGVLHNKATSTYQPKLEFAIAHNYGVIWTMEWCPSGCYDLIATDTVRRLGLLAVACSNSFVYIYLVPHPGQVRGSAFKAKPTYKLRLEIFTDLTIGEIEYYSTRLSWCKAKGHRFLAAGYSNGVVAIYDLKTETSLLKTEIDGVITLQPIQKFRAHLDAITALCLYHLHDGKRWLLTGSLDRDCKLWDLENISEPINYCKKFVITDAVWLVHWLCSVYSYDHGCITGAVPTSLNPARDFFASCTTFIPSNSRVTSISANEWANLFIQANDCGEVICGFPDQLLQGYDCDKKKSLRKSRCLASYTGMVRKSIPISERMTLESAKLETLKNQHPCASKSIKKQSTNADVNEARTYFEAEQKYGLVFCDLNMDYKLKEPTAELDKLLQSTHYFSQAKPDMYPLQSITKVSSNPNKQSFLYYACGYQAGIVRVSNVRFLCPEN